MWNVPDILAASEDLVWVAFVLVVSAIGWIIDKVRKSQEAQKSPPRTDPAREDDTEEEVFEILFPKPKGGGEPPSSRPLPRVPRSTSAPRPSAPPPSRRVPSRPIPPGRLPEPVPVPARGRAASPRPVARRPAPSAEPSPRVDLAEQADRADREALEKARRSAAQRASMEPAAGVPITLTRRRLREAIILNEVLGPPLALREPDSMSPWS